MNAIEDGGDGGGEWWCWVREITSVDTPDKMATV